MLFAKLLKSQQIGLRQLDCGIVSLTHCSVETHCGAILNIYFLRRFLNWYNVHTLSPTKGMYCIPQYVFHTSLMSQYDRILYEIHTYHVNIDSIYYCSFNSVLLFSFFTINTVDGHMALVTYKACHELLPKKTKIMLC